MCICWSHDPESRPTAEQICQIATSHQFCHLADAVSLNSSVGILNGCSVIISDRNEDDEDIGNTLVKLDILLIFNIFVLLYMFSSPDLKGSTKDAMWSQWLMSSSFNFYISISIFDTNGPIESKLSKNAHLVVLCKNVYFFLHRKSKVQKQEPPMCQKEHFFVCGAFIFQPILMIFFFKFLIWFSLYYNMPTDFIWILLFSRYKGSQNEVNIKILSYYFKSDLIELISLDSFWNLTNIFWFLR